MEFPLPARTAAAATSPILGFLRRAREAAWDGESPRGRGRAIAPNPIPFIDLSDEDDEDDQGMDWTMAWKEEVTEVLDPGLAWAMADQKAMDL